jgi:hypothetical protein
MKNALLDTLLADDDVCNALAWPIDFDLKAATDDTEWFTLTPKLETRPVASDGTGGLFLLCGRHQNVLHLISEGQAGIVARDLTEAIGLMAEYPYWRDLLKFSGGGVVEEMRRVAPYLERELQADSPEISDVRALLRERLALEARAGNRFDSLFNTFTVASNRAWRRA